MPVIEIYHYVFDSTEMGYRLFRPGEWGCPICGLAGGFHARPHSEVPKEFLKEKDWYKK